MKNIEISCCRKSWNSVFKNNFSYSRFHLHRTSQNSLRKKVYLLERRKEYMLSYSLNIIYYSCCGSSFDKSDHHAILHMAFENSKKTHTALAKLCRSFRDCDSPRVCDLDGHCKCPFTMDDINGVCLYRNNTGKCSPRFFLF